jgi:hypothetical protein
MKKNINVKLFVCFILILLDKSLLAYSFFDESKDSNQIHFIVEGPRALRDAIAILESQLNCIITYEDPKYLNTSSLYQAYTKGPVTPKIRKISFSYSPDNNLNKLKIIDSLLSLYKQVDSLVVFKVFQASQYSNIFNVIPISYIDNTGKIVEIKSFFDKNISLSIKGSFYSLTEEICNLTSDNKKKSKVLLDRPPTLSFLKDSIAINKKAEARSIINTLLYEYYKSGKGVVSYNLVRDPQDDFCALILYPSNVKPNKKLDEYIIHLEVYRPLSSALKILEEKLKLKIAYEDYPYSCSCDVMADSTKKPQMPRGGIFDFSFSTKSNPAQIILDCIDTYRKQNNAGEFALKQVDSVFYAFPIAGKDKDAIWKPCYPVLETYISLSVNSKPLITILNELCNRISLESKKKILLGTVPKSVSSNISLSFNVSNQPANVSITRLIDFFNRSLSWHLIYEPNLNAYLLNIYEISKIVRL